jgi:hypothetical protein
MDEETAKRAFAFIEAAMAESPLIHVANDDGSNVMGFAVEMRPPSGFVLERPVFAPGDTARVEIDLARVTLVKVIKPGETVRLFSSG